MTDGAQTGRRKERGLIAVLCAVPWAWLICFAAFTAAVAVKVGHFPSYSNPDPKHVAGLNGLYTLTVLMLVPALLSTIVFGALAVRALLQRERLPGGFGSAALYVAGLALISAVFFADAFGLGSWLLD